MLSLWRHMACLCRLQHLPKLRRAGWTHFLLQSHRLHQHMADRLRDVG
jgi:hypothetical protein